MPKSVAAYQMVFGFSESSATDQQIAAGNAVVPTPDLFTHEVPPSVVTITRAVPVDCEAREITAKFASPASWIEVTTTLGTPAVAVQSVPLFVDFATRSYPPTHTMLLFA